MPLESPNQNFSELPARRGKQQPVSTSDTFQSLAVPRLRSLPVHEKSGVEMKEPRQEQIWVQFPAGEAITKVIPLERWREMLADRQARSDLIEQLYDQVSFGCVLALERRTKIFPSEEVQQAMRIGINRLLNEYDPAKGPFMPWLRTLLPYRVIDVLREEGELSRTATKRIEKLERAQDYFVTKQARDLDLLHQEVLERAGITFEQGKSAITSRRFSRFERLYRSDSEGNRMRTDIKNAEMPVDSKLEREESFKDLLVRGLLTERESVAMKLCFVEGCTRAEIGARLGLSPSGVHCIIERSLNSIRSGLESYLSDEELQELKPTPPSIKRSDPETDRKETLLRDIRAKYPSLDHIPADREIAKQLNLYYTRMVPGRAGKLRRNRTLISSGRKIAEAVLQLQDELKISIYSRKIPKQHLIGRKGGGLLSYYLDPEVVGERSAQANRRTVLQERFPDLGSVRDKNISKGVAKLLGLSYPARVGEVGAALIKEEIVSPVRPAGLVLRDTPCLYLDPDVVNQGGEGKFGIDYAQENLKTYIEENIPTLDHVKDHAAFASALGTEGGVASIAVKLLRDGYLSPYLPYHHEIGGKGATSPYFREDIFRMAGYPEAATIVTFNLHRFLQSTCSGLDGISSAYDGFWVARRLLKQETQSRIELAQYAAEQELFSLRRPQGYPLTHGSRLSHYVNPEVVGMDLACANLRSWVEERFARRSEVRASKALYHALELTAERYPDMLSFSPLNSEKTADELQRRAWLA